MVAAHNSDLQAAQRLGLMTAFVPARPSTARGQTTDLEPEGDYDFVAANFLDLAHKIAIRGSRMDA